MPVPAMVYDFFFFFSSGRCRFGFGLVASSAMLRYHYGI